MEPTIDLRVGDVREQLRALPDDFVHAVVTSPPYYALRDYDGPPQTWADGWVGQLGMEPTPEMYVAHLVEIFHEVKRVLRPDGVCFINIGDTYAANRAYQVADSKHREVGNSMAARVPPGYKPKDLYLVPQRLAIALQEAEWWVRCDLIWEKPDAMPESVRDRPSRSHEYIWLLTKSARYFWDREAVREAFTAPVSTENRSSYPAGSSSHIANGARVSKSDAGLPVNPSGRNIRSVWSITTESYPGAHFAVMSKKVAEQAIKAGTSEKGCCADCGAPVERIVKTESLDRNDLPPDHPEWRPGRYDSGKAGDPQSPGAGQRYSATETLGWKLPCEHDAGTTPCVVLDPFAGSGTTLLVARRLARSSIGVELHPDYAEQAQGRLAAWWKDVTVARDDQIDGQLDLLDLV